MDRKITALIIDDDSQARNILGKFLELEDKVFVVAGLENTLHAVDAIKKHKPDVVFLDINMPYESGLKFASRMKEIGVDVLLVFTTAFRSYALEAFDMKPFDFLMKPFGVEEISNLVGDIEKTILAKQTSQNLLKKKEPSGKLKFKTNQGYLFLMPKEIVYVCSNRNYCELFLISGQVEKVYLPISQMLQEMGNIHFMMINRSTIINLNYIVRVDRKLKRCFLYFDEKEIELPITQKSLDSFENLKAVKLG
ncbi:MAG TPA: LytTR family DNA-binding domain-containing protein [Prolixibacteraceae bacterium]|nr:LytTR family DNA-binding domain-containing protein [Prolixibacteraceae bacterium]HPS12574.1 LytTR family DNA-binding domain-containing protein [Prolixibacteraceae bacterium]